MVISVAYAPLRLSHSRYVRADCIREERYDEISRIGAVVVCLVTEPS